MKLVTFKDESGVHIGAVVGDHVVDFHRALGPDADTLPNEMVTFIAGGEDALAKARKALERYQEGKAAGAGQPLSRVKLMAPLLRPPKIIMGGRNYANHVAELQQGDASIQIPPFPRIFSKYHTAIVGPGDNVVRPKIDKMVDFEGELTVVIGKPARHVEEKDAYDYVAGYTIVNDVTARTIQSQQELILSKSFETFCPIGPWIVTKDEISDPHTLTTTTYINDRQIAQNKTADMLYKVPQYISFLSKAFLLEPGDLISTGSPPGPGMYRDPPLLPQPGEVMRISVSGIGTLENPIVDAD
jgi:acylpyruvate hydrolase